VNVARRCCATFAFVEFFMKSWTWNTDQGLFQINVIGPRRVNLLFDNTIIGSYPTPEQAADDCGTGHHAPISEAFDGGSLGVSVSLKDWPVEPKLKH
jgi:hypothetical protein